MTASILYNPDEEDEPDVPSPKQSAGDPFVLLWLFAAVTSRVTIPALGCMLIGLQIGKKLGNKQLYATIGTIIGLVIAALLVYRYSKQINNQPKK